MSRHSNALIAGLLFAATLTLYISTLAPSVVALFDDSLEFQLVTYRLGIAHPTGYPLYTLLGYLFTLLPVGDVAYRVNLMSALCGAGTVALLYLLIVRLAGRDDWPARCGGVVGALMLAVSGIFWSQATVAEVYTLNAFFVVLLLLLAISPQTRLLWFLFGLSLTHHRTMILLLPALLLYRWPRSPSPPAPLPKGEGGEGLRGLVLSLLPLLLYLYLPLRGEVGSLDGTYQNTWAGFWRQVSASGYGLFVFGNPFGQERDLAFYWNLLQAQFYLTLPGLCGIFYLLSPNPPLPEATAGRGPGVGAKQFRRRALLLTGVAFLAYVTFNLFYHVSDIEVFFIPPFLLWAAWSGLGVIFLLEMALSLRHWVGRWLLAVLCAFALGQSYQANRPTYSWQVHDYGLDILSQPFPDSAAVVGILGEMTLLRYFQQTENRRPDLETVAADLEAERLAVAEKLLGEGKVVYLTRPLPGAAERWQMGAVGPLIRLNPPRPDTDDFVQPVTPAISLAGSELSRPPWSGAGPVPVRFTLLWRLAAPLETDLKVSARLMAGSEVVAVTDVVPVHFAYPTTAWRPGEVVADVYDLPLPPDLPAGDYTPLFIWYDPAQGGAEVGRVELPPLFLP